MIALAQLRTEAHLIGGIPGFTLAHVVYDIPHLHPDLPQRLRLLVGWCSRALRRRSR
jgi:hypothetical protein